MWMSAILELTTAMLMPLARMFLAPSFVCAKMDYLEMVSMNALVSILNSADSLYCCYQCSAIKLLLSLLILRHRETARNVVLAKSLKCSYLYIEREISDPENPAQRLICSFCFLYLWPYKLKCLFLLVPFYSIILWGLRR